ncbi:XTP/dITP diphosphatase [Domibacillus indicus]|uniref:XTP/dITP diphosphatase n=1 Tax=Domibacillus TaxID=1433999 RepID=UPI001F57873A|nr:MULTISPECIES: XTP/dITP diphosphatase [Domibacillus]MCI2254376.1 XTP/dITP diphosphatase [Domibacillus sp. PGB-M46]MCM3786909.1 XTP/dITP diphosphatase [Domibacillus indicus]
MNEVIVATRNAGKAKEFIRMFEPVGITVKTLLDYPDLPDVEETGKTFAENAFLKADFAARSTGRPAIADDSGLIIDALDGRPGVYSARYAGEEKNDQANNDKVLAEMKDVPREDRTGRFMCVLAVAFPDGRDPIYAEGRCEGIIGFEEAGQHGFGYDPLFIPEGYNVTMAQLDPEEKNRISHRANALQSLRAQLPELAGEPE